MKEENLNGKLRQNFKGGPYYCRLMVANGVRKEFALKTSDHNEACIKAADLDSIWDAPTKEAALEQIKAIRAFLKQLQTFPWLKYGQNMKPTRIMPDLRLPMNLWCTPKEWSEEECMAWVEEVLKLAGK